MDVFCCTEMGDGFVAQLAGSGEERVGEERVRGGENSEGGVGGEENVGIDLVAELPGEGEKSWRFGTA
jgi:hypothetical protein